MKEEMTLDEIYKLKTPDERFNALKANGHIGSISAEERKRALNGERIDHHITDCEASNIWSIENKHRFNKEASPRNLSLLYTGRRDNELSLYYTSILMPYSRIPKGSVSDYREFKAPE